MKFIHRAVSLLLAAVCAVSVLGGCSFGGESDKLVINEIMTKNASFLTDSQGETPDWIELYNEGSTDIHLKNWYLSDSERDPGKYAFPDLTMKAGEYRLVFCDGKDWYDAENDEIHANFSLASRGESLYLIHRNGKTSRVDVGESLKDISLGRTKEGTYLWFAKPSPGRKNNGVCAENAEDVIEKLEKELIITECCCANDFTLPSADGNCYGFVTVKNISKSVVRLSDYTLSDESSKVEKWHFQEDAILLPGKTLRVFCSGHNTVDRNGDMHTSFQLNAKDSAVILGLAGVPMQTVPIESCFEGVYAVINPKDESIGYCRLNDKSHTVYDSPQEAVRVKNMSVIINEVSTVKGNGAEENWDWIELYNPSDQDVSLDGWRLTDGSKKSTPFQFPSDTVLPAGGCRIVYCTSDEHKERPGSLYAGFDLNSQGETVYLTNAQGVPMDIFETDRQRAGVTTGRAEEGTAERVFFDNPTPGLPNDTVRLTGYAGKPLLSSTGGYVSVGTMVTILSGEGNAVYRYTTDGSVPTEQSPEFSRMTISKNTVLRVRAFKANRLPSDVATATFIIGSKTDRTLPIVCLASDPQGLFSDQNGIFAFGTGYAGAFPYVGANFWQDWERETNFEYYVDGEKVIDELAGLKVYGQYSRAYDQKSVALYFRSDYGTDHVTYPFFENCDHTTFGCLLLRAGGQDQNMTRIRDAYAAQVMKGHTSLVFQDWQPVAVYINGQYWGYFDLRERINAEWLGRYGGVDGNNLDLIKGNSIAKAGTNEAYLDLVHFAVTHDLKDVTYYNYVASKVDIENFIDYLITEIYFANGDTGNIKFYRERSSSGKWRWIMFDFDMTLRNDAVWDSLNMFEKQFNPAGHGAENGFSTELRRALLKNPDFRQRFIERFAEHLNSTFLPRNMKPILENMVARMDDEMPRHCERWQKPATYEVWQKEVQNLYRIIDGRNDLCRSQLKRYFKISDEEAQRLGI